VKEGFTAESAIAAVRGQDITLLKHSGMVSVQLQPPGSAPPGAAPAAADAGPKAPALPPAERKFNPSEPRIPGGPHGGEWGSGGGVVKDALKLTGRIQLEPGEHFVGSAKVGDGNGDLSVVMARVDGPHGPTIRWGQVNPEDTRNWRAANRGATVILDRPAVEKIQKVLDEAPAQGKKSVADYRADMRAAIADGVPEDRWPDPETDIASGVIRGSDWGDIEWSLTRQEGPLVTIGGEEVVGGEWLLGFDVKVTHSDLAMDSFNIWGKPAIAQKLGKALGGLMAMPGNATRATGHDTTPGHDELHHYWVYGEGLAKWAESPKPWTTLVALLTPHVGPEKAKTYASRWFFQHFGFYAGSDKNRVLHGKPPRGNKVGPG